MDERVGSPAALGGEGDFYDEVEAAISEADQLTATERWREFEAGVDELFEEFPPPPTTDVLDGDGLKIPVKHGGVSLHQLHPDLLDRLEKALADPRIATDARVSSGVRTYAQQRYLRTKFGPGRAADPDYVGRDGRRGSKHMIQSDDWSYGGAFPPGEFGYAVDVGFWDSSPSTAQQHHLRDVMAEYGLRLTVFRPYEWWHFELDPAIPAGAAVVQSATAEQEESPEMQIITDPESGRQWAAWPGPGGAQHVREYRTPRDGIGTELPGIAHIIDEQIANGTIIDAG